MVLKIITVHLSNAECVDNLLHSFFPKREREDGVGEREKKTKIRLKLEYEWECITRIRHKMQHIHFCLKIKIKWKSWVCLNHPNKGNVIKKNNK